MRTAHIYKKIFTSGFKTTLRTYLIYKREYLQNGNSPVVFSTKNPFHAYYKILNYPDFINSYILVSRTAYYVGSKNIYNIEEIHHLGGFMRVHPEEKDRYDTIILLADFNKEFNTQNFKTLFPKYKLWAVKRDGYRDYLVDFTSKCEGTMIIGLFSTRLYMRLDKAPKLVPEEKKDSLLKKAHFAVAWSDEKNAFF